MKKRLLLVLRLALLVGGVGALVLLINESGPQKVLDAILIAAPLLPVLILLEGAWVSWDVLAVRSLYGEAGKRVPLWAYIRSALIAYPFMGLLPAGRAGAEAARATALSPWVGGGRAGAVAVQAQGAGLLGNFLVSCFAYAVCGLALGFTYWLTWAVLINAVAGLVAGSAIFLAIKGLGIGRKLGKMFDSLKEGGRSFDHHVKHSPVFPPAAIVYSLCGRLTQSVQYIFFVAAIGGVVALEPGIVAQAIHIVGALAGDLVPSQMGVTDGAYYYAAPDVAPVFGLEGLGEEATARIFVIAILGRLAQIFWSIAGALTPLVWKAPQMGGNPDAVTHRILSPAEAIAAGTAPVVAEMPPAVQVDADAADDIDRSDREGP